MKRIEKVKKNKFHVPELRVISSGIFLSITNSLSTLKITCNFFTNWAQREALGRPPPQRASTGKSI